MAFCANCGKEVSPADSFCRNCGHPLGQPQPSPEPNERVSAWWWLLPFFLALIGGLVGFLVLERRNRKTATRILVFGVVWTVVGSLIAGVLIAGFAFGLYGSYSTVSMVQTKSVVCLSVSRTCTLTLVNSGSATVAPTGCEMYGAQVPPTRFSSIPIPPGGTAEETCTGTGGPYNPGTAVAGFLTLSNGEAAPFVTNWS